MKQTNERLHRHYLYLNGENNLKYFCRPSEINN